MSWAGAALREQILEFDAKVESVTIEELVQIHAQMLFRVAYSVVRNHTDSEDVVQETFLRAMKHGRLDSIENHKAWLVKIAWRVALDRARRIPPEPLDEVLHTLRSAEGDLEDAIAEKERSELLRALLQSLPSDLREVTVLSTIQEMTSADIAAVVGIPEGSVRTRLMRARQMLKQKLGRSVSTRSSTCCANCRTAKPSIPAAA
ncbi:MAG: RNA polymerase sigma factor [Burkholderiales bacterium]